MIHGFTLVRRGALLGALAGLSLVFAGGASAQTGFQASVTVHGPKPKPCPNGLFLCGTASTNYGAAVWTYDLTNLTPVSAMCASYQATVTFELADGSTLILDENGIECGPGLSNSSSATKSFGHPSYGSGNWTVQSASGQLGSISGAGTDVIHIAGAQASATYMGTP